MKYVLKLEYLGTSFCGWQKQSPEHESKYKESIQSCVEKALMKLFGKEYRPSSLIGCGRTDSGVHAELYYAQFALEQPTKIERVKILRALNALFPEGIGLKEVFECPQDFHVCHSVEEKTYEYRICFSVSVPVFLKNRALWIPYDPVEEFPWDRGLLLKTLKCFEGSWDFASFASSGHSVKDTRRTLKKVECIEEEGMDYKLLKFRFTGSGFLKQMVRNMVGATIEVLKGDRSFESIYELLNQASAAKRAEGSGIYCAPARGLFLVDVKYPSDHIFQKLLVKNLL